MIQPEMSPRHLDAPPQFDGQGSQNEIEPSSKSLSAERAQASFREEPQEDFVTQRIILRRFEYAVWIVSLFALLAIGVRIYQRRTAREETHPYWNYVLAAADASSLRNDNVFLRVAEVGRASVTPFLSLATADIDRETTEAVRELLVNNDLVRANVVMQQAQRLRGGSSPHRAVRHLEPRLEPNGKVLNVLKNRNAEFFHLTLFDCCDEDGDIVRVFISGEEFATIPLSRKGATISVPLRPGVTNLSLLGIHDAGGGGITLMFQTSQGDFFLRPIDVGQKYQVKVAVE